MANSAQSPVMDDEVRAALQRIAASLRFAKAHRCLALLTYLVRQAVAGAGPTSEYDIGLAVFRRDPATYFTADDPIVRVQMCRLRLRLADYYTADGSSDPLRIALPLGTYQAHLEQQGAQLIPPASRAQMLAFLPLDCLSTEVSAQAFTLGLNEELTYRLHRDYPQHPPTKPCTAAHRTGFASADLVLEGTLRMDSSRVRLSLRLRRGADGDVLWHELFDGIADDSIAAQEQLADRCVQALPVQLRLPTA